MDNLRINQREPDNQQKMLKEFNLPLNAKEIEVFSVLEKKEDSMFWRQTLSWVTVESGTQYNKSTGIDEPFLIKTPHKRDLGLKESSYSPK